MSRLYINLRILIFFFYLVLENIAYLNFPVYPGNLNNLKKEFTSSSLNNKVKIRPNHNYDLRNLLNKKLLNANNMFLNLLLANSDIEKKNIPVEIISDTQYQLGNKYYAEGNVVIILENGELRTEKLIYDKIEENLTLEGNILYFKNVL